ncbi:hypothetical protein [Cupriavidus oxalaticus]|uniref:Uncharacterized protein n=1 Tax=Cupriavidus oxalaticus TaxID=96344 RepID=A0A976GD59_9BURK|nr:hypothetical protein [Cupriavidus oxalaticus]QRQ85117.1 hypothetical protein JTE91_03265 [Cupriavidus oxalaticus]QRQ90795.1 hypothetical protein JTE92_09080 [Cupriavidus oxalaticus]WQD85321.1 hypothetical protein U0036_27205 [Cupriavidus oxalaticus]SPC23303.1 hypothetical protein CO2235_MP70081 [Cupriavidus oxalaticus]
MPNYRARRQEWACYLPGRLYQPEDAGSMLDYRIAEALARYGVDAEKPAPFSL